MLRLFTNMALRVLLGKPKTCFQVVPLVNQNWTQLRKCTAQSEDVTSEHQAAGHQTTFRHRTWSNCINEVKLLGYIGADPKLYNFDKRPFVFFPLATDSYFRNNAGETVRSVTWHKIVVKDLFSQNFALNNLGKGAKVYISGGLFHQKLLLDDTQFAVGEPITHVRSDKIILLRRGINDKERASDNTDYPETTTGTQEQ